MTVAALYVDPHGVYAGMPDVELWDEARDARQYDGPWSVVAHPPCSHWCQLASVNAVRYETFNIGDDGGCFHRRTDFSADSRPDARARHPNSLAWSKFGLPVPGHGGWTTSFNDVGWSTAVSQVAYGHAARKRTWLYYVGSEPPRLLWNEPPATAQVGSGPHPGNRPLRLQAGKSSATPSLFAEALVAMARTARVEAKCA